MAMTKAQALSHFGGPEATTAARVALMAASLGITRTAIYMWPDEEIPELRALQIEKLSSTGVVLPPPSVGTQAPPQ